MSWMWVSLLALGVGWEKIREDSRYVVERRALDGEETGMYEVRATTHSPFPPKAIFETVWKSEEYPEFLSNVKKVQVLSSTPKERVIYQQQSVPVVKNRDYTVRVRYEYDEASSLYQIFVRGDPDAGPPEQPGFVRIRRTHATWTFEPAAGGTDVTYVVASEAGGAVPQWIVNAAQKDTIVDYLETMLTRVGHNMRRGKP